MRDIQRRKVYAAEQSIRHLSEPLGSFSAAVDYVAKTQSEPWFVAAFGNSAPLSVSQFFGTEKAFYTPGADRITLPPEETAGMWAYSPPVLLHEIAHHVEIDNHGPRFAGAFLYMVEQTDPIAAFALQLAFTKHGVRAIPPRIRRAAS
jgi:putative metallohydrolase (TIGR04338 family)